MGVIRKIHIWNFRSIAYLEMDCQSRDMNILVGNNDIGKSNILRVLNLFFNGETDLGKPLDFWEDFNKNITRTSGKGQYIKVVLEIELKYEKDKYARWTRKWNNENERTINEIEVFNSNTHTRTAFEINTRARGWLNRIVFRYVPAIKSEKYFQHLFEELHDLLSKTYAEKFEANTTALINSIREITEEITNELGNKIFIKNQISLSSDLKAFFSALDFSLEDNGRKFNLKGRGDGIKIRHIPIVLKFMAENEKVFQKGALDVKTIWGFEEPENNLEMSHAFDMAKSFLEYSSKIDMFISTHSPAFYSLKDDKSTSCWFIDRDENNSTRATNLRDEDIDLDDKMGVLWYITPFVKKKDEEIKKHRDENEKLKAHLEEVKNTTEVIVFTEDEADDMAMIKKYIQAHGFSKEKVEYHSYFGKNNFHAAIVVADIIKSKNGNIKYCLFHRDMDVDGEYFIENNQARLSKNGRKNYILVMPRGYDLESEFINPNHINSLYSSISVERITELIAQSTKETENKSIQRLREKYIAVKTKQQLNKGRDLADIKWQDLLDDVDNMYHSNTARYRYGKTVLGVLSAKIQKELGQNIDLLQPSEFILRPDLTTIAESLGSI